MFLWYLISFNESLILLINVDVSYVKLLIHIKLHTVSTSTDFITLIIINIRNHTEYIVYSRPLWINWMGWGNISLFFFLRKYNIFLRLINTVVYSVVQWDWKTNAIFHWQDFLCTIRYILAFAVTQPQLICQYSNC